MTSAAKTVLALAAVVLLTALLDEEVSAALGTPEAEPLRLAALIGAVIITLGWVGAMAAIRAARRPREPQPGPPTADLGPEPPAVANLLANDFDLERDAVPATLLDLAARRVLDIEEAGDSYACRLRRPAEELSPYEARVFELVRRRAVDGVVPAGALTTGPQERAATWWREFRGEVIEDAQARQLSRDLWDRRTLRRLTVAAIVPAPLFLIAAGNVAGLLAYGFGAAILLGRALGGRRQRETEAGLRAASRWLGVRRHLREGAFEDLPPTAVAVWERYMAYAAALDVARTAVEAMPMGADQDRRAWSAYGGEWRLVRIRYPWLWPPAWGWRPWAAAAVSVVGLVVAYGAARLAGAVGWVAPLEPAVFTVIVRALYVLAVLVAVAGGAWSSATLIRSVADLVTSSDRRSGLVLRVRLYGRSSRSTGRHYVAVDDGVSAVIRAWRIRPELASDLMVDEGDIAAATVTRQLRFVEGIGRA